MKSIIGAAVGATLASILGAEAYVTVFPRLQMAAQRIEIDPISASVIVGGIPALFLVAAVVMLYASGRPSRVAGVVGLVFTVLCVSSYYLAGLQIAGERFGYHATVVVGLILAYGWAIVTGSGSTRSAAAQPALSEDSAA